MFTTKQRAHNKIKNVHNKIKKLTTNKAFSQQILKGYIIIKSEDFPPDTPPQSLK